MVALPIHRLTVEDYYSMMRIGVLREGSRIELLNGQLVDMLAVSPFHAGSVDFLGETFLELSSDRWITGIHNPVHLGRYDEPQPDLLLLKLRPDYYSTSHPEADDVFLLVEVSDVTLLTDREEKVPTYARAGIPEVWIVNLPERLVEVFLRPANGAYTVCHKIRPGQPLAPAAFPDAAIDTAALLG